VRGARFTQGQDLDLKFAAVIFDSQQIADPDVARRLDVLTV
jgi:hypothetical protein